MADNSHEHTGNLTQVLIQIEEHLAALRAERARSLEDWLTVEEVAKALILSRDTVERLIGSGQLKAAAIDTPKGRGRRSRHRVRRDWMEEFMQRASARTSPVQPATRRRRHFKTDHDFIG
jgi:excisionase family DNA binding protein